MRLSDIRYILFLTFILASIECFGRIVKGEVTDSITGEPLPFVNVYFKNSQGGVLTDNDGRFVYNSRMDNDSITVTAVGYVPRTFFTSSSYLKIPLSPSTVQLKELVVRPRKQKYSKKNNPAVELMEKLRKTAPRHDPRKKEYYSLDKQERISLGFNNYHFEAESSKAKSRFGFLQEYVDTSEITGLPYLALSTKERLATDIYSKDRGHKEIIRARRSNGIDDSFNQENITTLLNDIFRETDIYANDIILMQNRFVSPLSHIGANYYKYFITDTVSFDDKRFVELTFVPHNPESMGFNGRMYIPANDSVLYVRKLVMQVPSAINLNYVRNLYILQDYNLDSEGLFHKTHEVMGTELQLIPGTQVFYIEHIGNYGNPQTAIDNKWEDYFSLGGETIVEEEADNRNDSFWATYSLEPLNEAMVRPPILERLRQVPLFYWSEKILEIIVAGYVKTGKESKFDFGPVNTLVSANTVEGARFRIGGITTANLSERWFARGYVAYGCKDRKLKYMAETEWSFVDKKYHSREFPINAIRLSHEYDYDLIGQHYLFTNSDNVFLSLKRAPSDKVTMRRKSALSYLYENSYGWSFEASLSHQRQQPSHWLPFEANHSTEAVPAFLRHYDITSLFLKIRFAPGEKFYQSHSNRMPVNMDAPIIQLTHEYGPKGFLGSDYEINRTEISVQKRFWFSSFGFTDIILKGGMIWSSVYYPALLWPNANLSYTIQPESYSLMNPMEFATDHYFSWDVTYWGNGILFNRIPLVKKAKLREVINCKGVLGGLNKRNNPFYNKSLLKMPMDVATTNLSSKPYIELSAGIDNILTILRVDYVWRLTYRDAPGIDKSGLRVSLHFSF